MRETVARDRRGHHAPGLRAQALARRSARSATTGSSARRRNDARARGGHCRSVLGPCCRRKRWKSRGDRVARTGMLLGGILLDAHLVGGRLQPLHEGLHLGVAGHRGAHLALVVLGGRLQLARVHRDAGGALEARAPAPAPPSGSAPRPRSGAPRPTGSPRSARRPRRRGAARRRSRSGPRSWCARSPAGRRAPRRRRCPVMRDRPGVGHVGQQRAERDHHARASSRGHLDHGVGSSGASAARARRPGASPGRRSAPGTRRGGEVLSGQSISRVRPSVERAPSGARP